MITQTGDVKVKITDALLADAKFADYPAFDVALQVTTADGQNDWWRGEVSGNYGRGNFSDRTQAEITVETLNKIGWQHGADFSQIRSLINVDTIAHVETSEKNGKTYYNVKWIGGGGGGEAPKAIDASSLAQRLAMITGAPAVAQPAAAPAQATAASPFAGTAPAPAAPAHNPFKRG